MMRVAPAHVEERLRPGAHLDEAAVLQDQRVTVAERRCLGKVEQEGLARALASEAATVAILIAEHHGVSRDPAPMPDADDGGGMDHDPTSNCSCRDT